MTNIEPFNALTNSAYFSDTYSITFEFTNLNANILNYEPNVYTVINKLKNFTISLIDTEGDNILLNIASPGSLNAYAQKNQSNSTYLLIVQADEGANTQTDIILKYTDSYHQDSKYWKNLTISVSIFASEPPRYDSPLNNIGISVCDWMKATLPTATDLDGDLFTVSVSESTPSWIKLINSNTLEICPRNADIEKSMTSEIGEIILLDSTNASSINIFEINIDTSPLVEMDNIEDISLNYLQTFSLNLTMLNSKDTKLVGCSHLNLIAWSYFDMKTNSIIINPTNSSLVGLHWAKLSTVDGCGNINYSNKFNIAIKLKNPPVILNQLKPISLMKGEKRLFNYRYVLNLKL